MAQKDPEFTKLVAQVARMDQTMKAIINRIFSLEKENKLLRGRLGRATDHLGMVDRRTMTPRK